MNKTHRILVRPCYPDFLKNKMFSATHAQSDRLMEPFARWRTLAAQRSVEIDTWDMAPLESANVLWSLDLPDQLDEWQAARMRAPQAKTMLMLIESPLGRPHAFNPNNHEHFDAVLTYNWRLCDERRYFRFYLPNNTAQNYPNRPFSERKPLVLINTNRLLGPAGIFATRQPGLKGLPTIGRMFSGWSVSAMDLLRQTQGELYVRRRRLARIADREFPGLMDIFGHGWRGEPIGWISKVIKPKPYSSARGRFSGQKDDVIAGYRFALAFENAIGDVGYISEKIFDALLLGVVPIYLGDQRIEEVVDPESFIDARKFSSDRQLLQFVRDCPESEWLRFRDAGQKYIRSDAVKKFLSDSFAERMMDVIEKAKLLEPLAQ